jgi:hypothetical protein
MSADVPPLVRCDGRTDRWVSLDVPANLPGRGYGDDKCTQPVHVQTPNSACDTPPPKYALMNANLDRCSVRQVLYKVREPYAGPIFFRFFRRPAPGRPFEPACEPLPLREGQQAYALEPVPTSDLVELRKIDP